MNDGMDPSKNSLHEALAVATEVALEAGALLREALYARATASEVEESGEVHALADLKAERLIRARFTERFPTWGMRSEEEPALNQAPADHHERFWLVDPNDGTSAFIKGERGASVSIALIERGAPVLGVIYAYMGLDDRGDLFTWARGCGPLRRNGVSLDPRALWARRWEEASVFVSNSADSIASAYLNALSGARFRVAPGVAYRLALAAAGEGDLAISLAGPRDFDYAAGHALLVGAGGRFVDERGRDVTYHPTRPERLGFGLGGAPSLIRRLCHLEWGPVLRREGRGEVSLRRPCHADLYPNSALLSAALGAWWGWHIAWALTAPAEGKPQLLSQEGLTSAELLKSEALHSLEAQVAQEGGDQALSSQLRLALAGDEESSRAVKAHPLHALLCALLTSKRPHAPPPKAHQSADREGRCLALSQEGLSLTTPHAGGRGWPPRLIGALLSYRGGEMSAWGSDSARLLEAWLTQLSADLTRSTGDHHE